MNEMNESIKSRAVTGVFWNSFGTVGFQLIRSVTQILLARLLFPELFGVFAVVMSYVSVAMYLIENGLTLYLIRKDNLEKNDLYTVFIANVGFALLVGIIIYFISPVIKIDNYESKLVQSLFAMSSLMIVVSALGTVPRALLAREIRFRGQSLVQLLAAIISGVVGVSLSYTNLGIWTLVYYNLSFYLIQTVLLFAISRYKPSGTLDFSTLKESVSFSWKLIASGLLNAVYESILSIQIGEQYSLHSLGLYNQALRIRDGASQVLTESVQKVTYPLLSRYSHQASAIKQTSRDILRLSVFVIFPILLGIAVVSEELVVLLLDVQWIDMIPVLQLLAIGGLFIPLHKMNLNILTVMGRTDLYLRLEVYKKIVAFFSLMFVFYFKLGLQAVLWALMFIALMGYVMNTKYSYDLIDYGLKEQLQDMMKPILVNTIMIVAVLAVSLVPVNSMIIRLAVKAFVGAFVYIIFGYFILKDEFRMALQFIQKMVAKLSKKGVAE